ncbi:GNAT family N-acetyltransferase [Phytomonospora endophytica]|uniref:N-acetylglutamate synthase-like GNAT family acetyltransferase n=1 Tax=Phytomonospora endophytica TaxID=714109 RepID=A0A841FQ68_9ACTN|nr:GNAT family N-acetyltransferase [Phytomonospora endophytica]MBB6035407.1 N-acetylglutamate synthase-like GNAT family acetyltransferase [Phytomonospora endophytica]GIG63841.1 N-acetyltransferase [Phytomonospora endophytica]
MSGFEISTDPARLDLDWLHERLSTDTYWATGRSRERMLRTIENSVPYGVFAADGTQVAFARLVTDRATFAWLSDVYVDRSTRGSGVGKLLMERIMADVETFGLRRMVLATDDAHELYRRYGFEAHPKPEMWMERRWEDNPA